MHPLNFMYSLKVPPVVDDVTTFNGIDIDDHFIIRYDTLTLIQIGEIVSLRYYREVDLEYRVLNFQVLQLIRAYEGHSTLEDVPNRIYHLVEDRHPILLFHAYGKRLKDTSRICY